VGDFKFIKNPISGKWTIFAPKRAERPDAAKTVSPLCPFCIGREKEEPSAFRVGGKDPEDNWQIRVILNKFPFAPFHEIIIHSPDHHKNFEELPLDQVVLIFDTYRQRYNTYRNEGRVYIFHNRGERGGESLPHPHTQLTVIPNDVELDIPARNSKDEDPTVSDRIETEYFLIYCPLSSQWPDEIWISSKKSQVFGDASDSEIQDLSFIIQRIIQILDLRHGHEFPFNFYIYPGNNWYLRIMPRAKILGGFEIGTGIFVNTQDPKETMEFLIEHFETPNVEKIKTKHRAAYRKAV